MHMPERNFESKFFPVKKSYQISTWNWPIQSRKACTQFARTYSHRFILLYTSFAIKSRWYFLSVQVSYIGVLFGGTEHNQIAYAFLMWSLMYDSRIFSRKCEPNKYRFSRINFFECHTLSPTTLHIRCLNLKFNRPSTRSHNNFNIHALSISACVCSLWWVFLLFCFTFSYACIVLLVRNFWVISIE